MRKTGFTLFEVCIVLALITFMVVMSMGYLQLVDKSLVRNELDTLYMVFVKLQQRARFEHKPIELVFDVSQNSYTYLNTSEKLAPGIVFGVLSGVHGPPSQPVHPIHNPVTFPRQRVIFFPDGKIQPGTVYLTNTAHTVLYALSCPISQISYIRRYIFDQKWALLS